MTPKHTIPVLGKALQVISTLAEGHGSPTTKELSQLLGIPVTTCYRILQTFCAFDWLRPAPSGHYEFSLGLLPLLKPLSDYQRMFEQLRAPLEALVEKTHLMAKISIKQGQSAITVFRVESPRMVAPSAKLGTAFPLVFGSSGACLLCGMDDEAIAKIIDESPRESWEAQAPEDVWGRVREARAQGSCFDTGSYHAKIHTVSAPIFRGKGDPFAAVSLIGWPEDFAPERHDALQSDILRTARHCETILNDK